MKLALVTEEIDIFGAGYYVEAKYKGYKRIRYKGLNKEHTFKLKELDEGLILVGAAVFDGCELMFIQKFVMPCGAGPHIGELIVSMDSDRLYEPFNK